jgi:succinate-acetate transporter protein
MNQAVEVKKETKHVVADVRNFDQVCDPTALGVFGLAMVTLVASTSKLGWTTGTTYVIPWAMFLGSIAQIWASAYDFKRQNLFGGVALGAYGLFWMGVSMHWAISAGWLGTVPVNADPSQLGVAFVGYGVFSFVLMLAAMEINKALFFIMVEIVGLFVALSCHSLHIGPEWSGVAAGWIELVISINGFYLCSANFLNNFFGRVVLPVGAPMGVIRGASAHH